LNVLDRRADLSAEGDAGTWWGARLARPELTFIVARDMRGQPLAFVAAVIDDTVCLIDYALASDHLARWALHDHLVRLLIAQRVTHLLATGGGVFEALGFTPNVQRYQHMLGYELRHVVPATARPATRRRRLLASLAVVAATASIIVPRATASTTVRLSLAPTNSDERSQQMVQAVSGAGQPCPSRIGTDSQVSRTALPIGLPNPEGLLYKAC
jgi:hypothetical protein